jgi:hypothetical protein
MPEGLHAPTGSTSLPINLASKQFYLDSDPQDYLLAGV